MGPSVRVTRRERAAVGPRPLPLHVMPQVLGSRSATLEIMDVIPQKVLRNHVGEVLRRVEAGESLTVTVAGRPVAELRPVGRRRWVSGASLAQVWRGPAPRDFEDDVAALAAGVIDPFTP
ncbi:type II toxin-antitoxin system Phd/YefM family antitoxin [Ornithinimicrobium cavernae]|uniref:type II toxin-antitoxin system Phd/YefM family antitoxin n=1 Tax=Ornithinimicrobium cavernae TaxID=2666047 RepID=UPI003B02740D